MVTSEKDIFKKRKKTSILTLVLMSGSYLFFRNLLGFNESLAFSRIPNGFIWMVQNFIPTSDIFELTFIAQILTTLLRTIMIAITATTTASIIALISAIFASRKTAIHPIVSYFIRFVAMFFRNIPLIAWTMILLISFRQNEFTGYLALFLGTYGYLTRTFTEIIDELSEGVLEALSITGASYFQIVCQGILPMISSQVISWVLFMIEANIRDATLVGLLTGTGIGFLFNLYVTSFRYPMASMVLLFIIMTVLMLEMLSNRIRRLII